MRTREKRLRQRRAARHLPDAQQGELFSGTLPVMPAPPTTAAADFISPRPEGICVGSVPLRQYLEDHHLGWVIRLREELEASDLSALLAAYSPKGRRAIHPAILLGLVVYGILERKWSLRDLEQLALRDVAAWWLCGGLQPDHSTLGDFLLRHEAVLSEEYFVTLTRQLLRRLRLAPGMVAGDGTVLEAAASHYRALRADAAREAGEETARLAADRAERSRRHGDDPAAVRVSPTEPEAVSQPLKNGARRPSYKPSVWATRERLVVGQHVHPSNEATSLPPLLNQYQRLWQTNPTHLLCDANYHQNAVAIWAGAWDLDLLCPSGKADGGQWERETNPKQFDKRKFVFDEERDRFVCPAGHDLRPLGRGKRQDGLAYRRFGGAPCAACALRDQCTDARDGRTVKRFAGDDWKEAMAYVMTQKGARDLYRQRKAMVEPVFAALRLRQGLTRFHRHGLARVRLEFALHCLAYNLGRALRLQERSGITETRLFLLWRLPGRVAILILVLRRSPRQIRLALGVLVFSFH